MSTSSILRLKKLRNLKKSRKGEAVDSSSISRLPDEIIRQIFSRLSDLKTLCLCYLVSKRFSSIVLEVDAISFTAPRLNPLIVDKNSGGDVAPSKPISPFLSSYYRESFLSASRFLSEFKGVKSLCIELPSSCHTAADNLCLFKSKIKFGSSVESIIFLSPNSVCDNDGFYLNGNGDEEENSQSIGDMLTQKFVISLAYLKDVMHWHNLLLWFIMVLPVLEKVSITDSGKTGRLSLSGEELNEVKEWVHSSLETVFNIEIPHIWNLCYIPFLKLPVSGYVMKGVYCTLMEKKNYQGGYDFLKKSEVGVEEKQEVVFTEAMMEILEKHRGMMHAYNPFGDPL